MSNPMDRFKNAMSGSKEVVKDAISCPVDEGGGYSASRLMLVGGGGALVGLAIAALAGIVFWQLQWEPIKGVYEFLKDLYLYMVGGYGADKIGRGVAKRRMENPVGE